MQVLKPDGYNLYLGSFGTSGSEHDLPRLPATGTYTIFVDPTGTNTGSVAITISQDVSAAAVVGDPPITEELLRLGQNGRITFEGDPSMTVSVDLTSVTIGTSSCCSTIVTIYKPDGTNLVSQAVGTGGGYVETVALPMTGTYTIFVDPQVLATGNITVRLNPPIVAQSHYMDPVNPQTLYDLGYTLGEATLIGWAPKRSLVILDYGCQAREGGVWGARSVNSGVFHPMADLKEAVFEFGRGFFIGTGPNITAELTVALGMNNSCTVSEEAGRVLADAVDQINNMFSSIPPGSPISLQVIAVGANDIEIDFCKYDPCPGQARAWADGFSNATSWWYEAYGSCDGCPPYGNVNYEWTQEDIWYVSWRAAAAFPFPQIFATSGANAAQWERISEYSIYTKSYYALNFDGALTQLVACAQGTCSPDTQNDWRQGWTQLWRALNVRDVTGRVPPAAVRDSLPYVSDINYVYG